MYAYRRKKHGFHTSSFPERHIIVEYVFLDILKMYVLLTPLMDGMRSFTHRRHAIGRVLRQ
jgi:hypothetical protein